MRLLQHTAMASLAILSCWLPLPASADVIDSGGGASSSAGVIALQSIGEPVIGLGTTPGGQTVHAGFAATLVDPGTPGGSPEISLSATSKAFGSVSVGSFLDLTLTINNIGDAQLNINSFTGLPSDGFSISSAPSTPFFLPGASSINITLRFTPGSPGAHAATLHIISNDSDEGNLSVDLTGTGTELPPCFVDQFTTSPDGLDIAGFITSTKVKHQTKTGISKLSGKLSITQLRMPDDTTSATPGVPSHTISVYLVDDVDPCSLSQLPTPLVSVVTKAGKPGKPGLPPKTVKAKYKAETSDPTTSRSLLIVLDPLNTIPETDKHNNFLVTPPLP